MGVWVNFMAHKTKINGTTYDVNGGSCKVNGTKYNINKGKTKINGTGYDITFGKSLSSYAEGDIVYINEGGSPVEFYVAKHDYESSLNGTGRTLVVRKDTYDDQVWDNGNVSAYASSDLDSWFNSTYKNILDADIRSLIGTTKIRYSYGNGGLTMGTLERAIFALSLTELGQSHSWANTEGSPLPIASTLRIAYRNGSATSQWTRSPQTFVSNYAWRLNSNGNVGSSLCQYSYGSRPAFTLPSSTVV